MTAFYAWPAVLALGLLAATSRTERLGLAGVYFGLLGSISAYTLFVSPKLTAAQLLWLWLGSNGPATLLFMAFLRRRVRSVGPLILPFMLIAVLGSQLAPSLLLGSDRSIRTAVAIGGAIGLGGSGVFWGVIIAGFLLFTIPGWWLLRRLGNLYRAKRLGDQSLTLDALFLFFAITQSLDQPGRYIWTGAAAFIAYKTILRIGFHLFGAGQDDLANSVPVLLLLRVFSLGERSERLFDALTKRWRRIGSVVMIAGPDLVNATVQPHEFLEFIGGRISRRFVEDKAGLDQRFASLDLAPDPDGRYRINQFFCRADTWRMTVRSLIQESSVVLMDLRGFSPRNEGCIYELKQLIDSADLRLLTFLVDSSTDRGFLDSTLQKLWSELTARSPNATIADPAIRLLSARFESARELRRLLQAVLTPPATAQSQTTGH